MFAIFEKELMMPEICSLSRGQLVEGGLGSGVARYIIEAGILYATTRWSAEDDSRVMQIHDQYQRGRKSGSFLEIKLGRESIATHPFCTHVLSAIIRQSPEMIVNPYQSHYVSEWERPFLSAEASSASLGSTHKAQPRPDPDVAVAPGRYAGLISVGDSVTADYHFRRSYFRCLNSRDKPSKYCRGRSPVHPSERNEELITGPRLRTATRIFLGCEQARLNQCCSGGSETSQPVLGPGDTAKMKSCHQICGIRDARLNSVGVMIATGGDAPTKPISSVLILRAVQ
ncbi:hypothetical protein C8R45DRAFT_942455 [Mycena sanguinolenta]|nr:hypothetical protein C8R45DRAFT_942455 [Mycena sanguinolenta]